MTWKWQKFEETIEGIGSLKRELATNDKGVSIDPWGTYGGARQVLFKYNQEGIEIEFKARRSPRNVSEPDKPLNNVSYQLGPICEVWIDDRRMKFEKRQPLSAAQRAVIEETITEFLVTAFRDCRLGIPPYVEQVEFF